MGKTILVVDDFESSRNILSRTLESAGYTVLQEGDGNGALKSLNAHTVDLIITDLNMPQMDGISLIKSVRGLNGYQYTPVILLTTSSSTDKKQLAKDAGATAWLEKPFQIETLLNNVKKIIR